MATLVFAGSCAKSISVKNNSDAGRQAIGFSAFTHLTKASAIVGEGGARNEGFKMEAFKMSGIAAGNGVTAEDFFSNPFGFGINSAYPDSWNTDPTHYWPVTAVTDPDAESVATESLSFFSYGPTSEDGKFSITFDNNSYSGTVNRTLPKLNVSVAALNQDQKDILAAMAEFNYWESNNKVNIQYNHILSAITFSAKTTSPDFKFIVDEIVVGVTGNDKAAGRLFPAGTYSFSANNTKGTWSNQTGAQTYYDVPLGSAVEITKENTSDLSISIQLNTESGILMLIPQQLNTTGAEAYFFVKYRSFHKNGEAWENEKETSKFALLHTTGMVKWEAGKKYNYVLNLEDIDQKPIEYEVYVTNWEDWYETSPDIDIDFQNDINSESLPTFEEGTGFETNW